MKRSLKRIALALLAIVTPCLAWAATTWSWTDVAKDQQSAGISTTIMNSIAMWNNRAHTLVATVTYGSEIGEGTILSYWHNDTRYGGLTVKIEGGKYVLVNELDSKNTVSAVSTQEKSPLPFRTDYLSLRMQRVSNKVTAVLSVNGEDVATLTEAGCIANTIGQISWGKPVAGSSAVYSKTARYSVWAIGSPSSDNPSAYTTTEVAYADVQQLKPMTCKGQDDVAHLTVADAVAAGATAITLTANVTEDVVLPQGVSLDISTYTLTGTVKGLAGDDIEIEGTVYTASNYNTWTPTNGNAWSETTNWSNGIPTEGTAYISVNGETTLTLSAATATLDALVITGEGSLNIEGDFAINANNITVGANTAINDVVISNSAPKIKISEGKELSITSTGDNGRAVEFSGGGTLVKKGDKKFALWANDSTEALVLNGVTLDVQAGTFEFNGHNKTPKTNNATIKIAGGTSVTNAVALTCDGATSISVASGTGTAFTKEKTITLNGNFTKTGAGTLTIPAILAGSSPLTVSEGELILTAANTLTGNVTIASDAILDVSGESARLFSGGWFKGNDKLVIRGKLIINQWDYSDSKGLGALGVNTGYVKIDGGTVEFVNSISDGEDRGFTVTSNGATFILPAGKSYTNSRPTDGNFGISNGGTLNLTGEGSYSFGTGTVPGTVSIAAGTTLAQGSFTNLTFAAGSKLDASAGAITATSVILPTEGAVAVTLAADAENGDVVINCPTTGLNLQALNSGTPKFSFAANTDSTAIVLSQAPVCSDGIATSYMTLQEAVDAFKAAGATEMSLSLNYDTSESVKLPDGCKLSFWSVYGAEFSGTVTDIYGNPLEADENGSYTCPTYVAKASGMGLDETGYTTLQDAVAAATGAMGTVTLLDNVTISETITIDTTMGATIDLGGKTVTGAETLGTLFHIKSGVITVQNGAIAVTNVAFQVCDKVMDAAEEACDFTEYTWGYATLTLAEGLTVTSSADNCVLMYNGAVLSTAAALTSSGEYATIQGTGLNANNATMINITGGSVTSTSNHAIYHPQPGTLTITDGTISGKTGIEMRAGTLDMQGGKVTATGTYEGPESNGNGSTVEGAAIVLSQHVTGENVTANITGGEITATSGKTFVVANTTGADPVDVAATIGADVEVNLTDAQILIPTLELTGNETDGYTLTEVTPPEEETYVAAIGENKYATLQEAYDNAAENDTITLLGNTEAPGIKIEKSITLDLNGKTLTLMPPAVGSTGTETLGIQILQSTESITIKNGTIDVCAENADADKPIKMLIQNYSQKLTLSNVTLDGTNLVEPANMAIYVLSNNQGTVTIGAGTTITAPTGAIAFDVCKYRNYEAPTVTVAEGAIIGGKVEVSGGTLDNDSSTALDVVVSSGTVEGSVTVDETNSSYLVKVGDVYCNKATTTRKGTETQEEADARAAAAAELFTGITAEVLDGTTTATIDWDFGISDITVNRDENNDVESVTVTAKVTKGDADQSAAGYAAGVTVAVYADDDKKPIASTTTTDKGEAKVTVTLNAVNGKDLKVKVSK